MTADTRLQQLSGWIHAAWPDAGIEVASADASFRRYFRIAPNLPGTAQANLSASFIAMDAPPEHEDCGPFVDITSRLRNAGVHAPEIIRQSVEQGFLLLEDLGSETYLEQLKTSTADPLYGAALDALVKLQQADTNGLPEYDETRLQQEMQLMPEWFLQTHLGIEPDPKQQKIIQRVLAIITAHVLQQPQVFVHRDYHSRNLMITSANNPGVIDYQDAVLGPITYDLVSLLRDCYIAWPPQQVEQWALHYKQMAQQAGLIDAAVADKTFLLWLDYMGLQRHIKVLGIFARLNHRDGKSGYLQDLPLTLHYVLSIGKKYPLIQPLIKLFEEWGIPEKIGAVDSPAPTSTPESAA